MFIDNDPPEELRRVFYPQKSYFSLITVKIDTQSLNLTLFSFIIYNDPSEGENELLTQSEQIFQKVHIRRAYHNEHSLEYILKHQA